MVVNVTDCIFNRSYSAERQYWHFLFRKKVKF